MSEIKVNKISPKQTCTQLTLGDSGDTIIVTSGANLNTDTIKNLNSSSIITQTNATTITLGFSGATIAIATGASQTGFGRAGSVNWSSTVQTSNFNAVSGNGYFVNTTAGSVTVTLPSTPSAGDIVAITDYAGTAATNNIIIGRNGSNIEGTGANAVISANRDSITLVYIDSTQGWLPVSDNTGSTLSPFVSATGGTVLTCGNFKTHVFTSSGCFTVTNAGSPLGSNTVEYLVVAAGGGGGNGGGGGGGFRQNYPSPVTAGLPVAATTYPITIGAGANQTKGTPSVFSSITSAGGGNGGHYAYPLSCQPQGSGSPGGSGGGAVQFPGGPISGSAGSGNTPPVSPPQGNNGGPGGPGTPIFTSGSGGGAGGSGSAGSSSGATGAVGSAIADAFFGPTAPSYGTPGPSAGRWFSGGGTSTAFNGSGPGVSPAGGGGSAGVPANTANAGTINTGGGGGATTGTHPAGGSGIIAIRYKYQ